MSTTKYNVYYGTNPLGPWTLANVTPLDHEDIGNSYTVSGLYPGVQYYVTVVGGVLDEDDTFIPLVNQFIGPTNRDASTINGIPVPYLTSRTRAVVYDANSSLDHLFSIITVS
jgi:hypothetical protein